jgi:mRNA interferase RelE/StbE
VAESRAYEVRLLVTAQRQLLRVPARIRSRVADAIRGLGADPRPPGCSKLTGSNDYFRIRVADYGVLYEVRDRDILVLVIKIGHRRDVYR